MENCICNDILKKIAGVVIWYNPEKIDVKNIESYIKYIDKLYVVDNSIKDNLNYLSELNVAKEKIEYIHFKDNKGIAYPLNYISEKARKENYFWLLTMDQDSNFVEESFKNFYKYLENENIAIIAPQYLYKNKKNIVQEIQVKELDKVITSGNLINLEIHKNVGGFDENLFIDEVDHEYCYKINSKYKIIQVGDVYLNHALGQVKIKKIFGFEIKYTEHSAIRKYYIWRNRLYIMKKYSYSKKEYLKYLIKDLIKIVFFERDKKNKLISIIKGIKDFKKNNYKKLEVKQS